MEAYEAEIMKWFPSLPQTIIIYILYRKEKHLQVTNSLNCLFLKIDLYNDLSFKKCTVQTKEWDTPGTEIEILAEC